MKKGLIIFDVDGVLLDTKIGGLKHLAMFFTDKRKVTAHVREYEKKKKKGPWGLELLASFFKGAPKKKMEFLSQRFCQKNLMAGAKETIKELKKRGYLLAAFSSNDMISMRELKKILDLDFIGGNKLEFSRPRSGSARLAGAPAKRASGGQKEICTGRLADKVDRYEKARRVKKLVQKFKFSAQGGSASGGKKSQVYIIGDSVSDLPMAKYGTFIAFNPKDKDVKKAAKFIVNKKNLKEILKYIP